MPDEAARVAVERVAKLAAQQGGDRESERHQCRPAAHAEPDEVVSDAGVEADRKPRAVERRDGESVGEAAVEEEPEDGRAVCGRGRSTAHVGG